MRNMKFAGRYFFAAVLLAGGIFVFASHSTISVLEAPTDVEPNSAGALQSVIPVGPYVRFGKVSVPVEVVEDVAAVTKGLSGRVSLDENSGMLFVFSEVNIYRFWMPDMHFPIDIIWIDENKNVVGISADVSNEFDPANPRFYTPPRPVRYVLEVNAGFSGSKNIKIGSPVTFHNIEIE